MEIRAERRGVDGGQSRLAFDDLEPGRDRRESKHASTLAATGGSGFRPRPFALALILAATPRRCKASVIAAVASAERWWPRSQPNRHTAGISLQAFWMDQGV
jgi:hypothetical protein